MVLQMTNNAGLLDELPVDTVKQLQVQAKQLDQPTTLYAIKRFQCGHRRPRGGFQPQLPLEMALIEDTGRRARVTGNRRRAGGAGERPLRQLPALMPAAANGHQRPLRRRQPLPGETQPPTMRQPKRVAPALGAVQRLVKRRNAATGIRRPELKRGHGGGGGVDRLCLYRCNMAP